MPHPYAGYERVDNESKKQAASLPSPPFPSPASGSWFSMSNKGISISSSESASFTLSTISIFTRLLPRALPIKNSIDK